MALLDLFFIERWKRWAGRRVIFRCWVAAWLCALSMLIRPVELGAGQAPFLPIILVFIKPPAEPAIVFLVQSLFAGIVTLIVWAWCVLAGKFSLLARDYAQDARTYYALNQTIYQNNPHPVPGQIEGELIQAVFKGAFLQTKSSVVFAAFLFIGAYFIFLIRAHNVRLFYVMVFAIILLSIYSTIAPLIPSLVPASFIYLQVAEIYLTPYAYYLAISFFCSLFIFPSSVASTTLESLRLQLSSLHAIMDSTLSSKLDLQAPPTSTSSSTSSPTVEVPSATTLKNLISQRIAFVTQFEISQLLSSYLTWEISIGRASGTDIRIIGALIRNLATKTTGLTVVMRDVTRRCGGKNPANTTDLEWLMDEKKVQRHETVVRALEVLMEWSEFMTRWDASIGGLIAGRGKRGDAELVRKLRAAVESLRNLATEDEKSSPQAVRSRSNSSDFIIHIYDIFLEEFSKATITLLDYTIVIAESPVKLWLPGTQSQSHAHAAASLLATSGGKLKDATGPSLGASSSVESLAASLNLAEGSEGRNGKRLGMLRSGANVFGNALGGNEDVPNGEDDPDTLDMVEPVGSNLDDNSTIAHKIYCAFKWFTDTKSTFSLKVAFLAVALACPAWITNNGTAEFYYKNKGIWALVTALTAKGMFSGETTFGFIQRAMGVVIGGVIGLVMWYCSTGVGHGNAYGLAAVFAVVLIFAIPYRIWSTNFLLSITVTTTGALVVGYSWADETVPVVFAPGVGYEVFYKRTLLVLIGITGAWLIDLLPRPKPGREDLRRTYSTTILELGSITAGLISDFRHTSLTRRSSLVGTATARTSSNPSTTASGSAHSPTYSVPELSLIAVFNKLRLSAVRIMLARLEPSLRRKWSEEQYLKLQEAQFEIVDLLGILRFAFDDINREMGVEGVVEVLKVLEAGVLRGEKITALLNIFAITSMSLRTQLPLPKVLPSPTQQGDGEASGIVEDIGLNRTKARAVMIIEGTFVELGKEADKLVVQCQKLFGTNLSYRV